jgi:ketosteroid isomerase-like protein
MVHRPSCDGEAPSSARATGSEAGRKVWTQLFAAPDLVFSNAATKVEAARSGDLAYETGAFEESSKDGSGKTVRAVGKYVVVWKSRRADSGRLFWMSSIPISS